MQDTYATLEKLREEYLMLKEVSIQFQDFVQPIILSCYGINIYLVVVNVSKTVEYKLSKVDVVLRARIMLKDMQLL